MFSDHKGIKLETNRKKAEKSLKILELTQFEVKSGSKEKLENNLN